MRVVRDDLEEVSAPVSAAPNGDRPTALQLGQFWDSSKMTWRAAALRRILDDRFVATFGAGKPYDKEGFIKVVVDDETDTTASQDLTDRMVRVDRDTAVIVETDTVRGTTDGKPYSAVYRITTVYIKRGGRWVALAEHLVKAPPPK